MLPTYEYEKYEEWGHVVLVHAEKVALVQHLYVNILNREILSVLQYVVFTLLYLRKLLSWEHGNFLLYIIYLIYVPDP